MTCCPLKISHRILRSRSSARTLYGASPRRAANIVVTPIKAAAMYMRTAEYYAGLARTLRRAETMEPDALVEHLNIVGYTKADVVEMPGEYALRGGILDVFPPEADRPARVEFFGDEIESIRSFDPTTQRSLAARDEITLAAALRKSCKRRDPHCHSHPPLRQTSGRLARDSGEHDERAWRRGLSRLGVLCARRRLASDALRSASARQQSSMTKKNSPAPNRSLVGAG